MSRTIYHSSGPTDLRIRQTGCVWVVEGGDVPYGEWLYAHGWRWSWTEWWTWKPEIAAELEELGKRWAEHMPSCLDETTEERDFAKQIGCETEA